MKSLAEFLCWCLAMVDVARHKCGDASSTIPRKTRQRSPHTIEETGPDIVNPHNEKAFALNPEDTALLADPAIVPVPDMLDTPLDVTYLLPQSCFGDFDSSAGDPKVRRP